ncbi:MAG: RNA polymerase sigma factor [Polyangiaceae bacterium]
MTLPLPIDTPPEGGVSIEPSVDRLIKSGIVNREPLTEPEPYSSEQRDAVLAELLRLHYASVWRTLRRVGVEESRVEDAAQEVFIVASRKLHQIKPGCERRYLLNSALRVAANYRRAGKARREVLDEDLAEAERDPAPSADRLLSQKRLRQLFDEILSTWSSDIRTAFLLFELEGLSVPEIAELTGAPLGTVSSRLRRGRELFLAGVKRLKARGLLDGESP